MDLVVISPQKLFFGTLGVKITKYHKLEIIIL